MLLPGFVVVIGWAFWEVLVTLFRDPRWVLVTPAGDFLFLLVQGGKPCPE